MLADMTYLSKQINTPVNDIWELPHSHYLAYLKHSVTFSLQETEEGQEILDKFERYMNPRTEADLGTIRQLAGYKPQKESG